MIARARTIAAVIALSVIALSAIVSPLHTLLHAQPSTEGLADVSETRPKFGIDIGGTAGPLSPLLQQTSVEQPWVEQAAVLSYLVRAHARYPVRAVAWLFRSERLQTFGAGTNFESSNRISKRVVSLGALVDMFDKPMSRGRFRHIRVVGALGGGVVPYATTQSECTACGEPGARDKGQGAGAQLAGSIGLRWKRLAIDQQVFTLLASGGGLGSISGTPFTMGVRF